MVLRLYKLGDDKMKKATSIALMVVAIFTISACGSKLDKTGEEFKDSIIKDSAYGDEYSEDSFSFLMYKDKEQPDPQWDCVDITNFEMNLANMRLVPLSLNAE